VTTIPEVVDTLVSRASPVRRLRPPFQRALLWLALAAALLGLISIEHGVRGDLAERLRQPGFAAGLAAAVITGILSAIAAFTISIPDRSRWWLLLPVPSLLIWVSTVSYECFADWISIGPDGIHVGEAIGCFASLVLTSVPLGFALIMMLRYAALVRSGPVAMMGGLAVAAITSTGLSLFHDLNATMMILVWNLGTTVLITGLGTLFGRGMFRWMASPLLPGHSGT
jgi:hypothetical protein